jgi:hypothetical protein
VLKLYLLLTKSHYEKLLVETFGGKAVLVGGINAEGVESVFGQKA